MSSTEVGRQGDVLLVGGEPAALSCAARLLRGGARVIHVYPEPWGLFGASRDIGLAYPELGEPLHRLEYALGDELAHELHAWGKAGIASLLEAVSGGEVLRRGSRLQLSRDEQQAGLSASDALDRQRLGDEVRLMSGAAGSNYAPLSTSVHQACFETHAVSFAPVPLCEFWQARLAESPGYLPCPLPAELWRNCRLESDADGAVALWDGGEARGEVAVVAAALESGRLLGRFSRALVPLLGQAFRSEPLREKARSSVVGLTASWGNERYRFDDQARLLGCGIDPSAGERHEQPVVLDGTQEALWRRACTLFSDLEESGDDVLRWGVLFTTSCDGLPLIGPLPGEPRLQVVAGFSVSAWSRGVKAGEVVAESLLSTIGEERGLRDRCSPRRLV